MTHTSILPSVEVTIGGQVRLYHAFVTTAGPELDGPSTLTLYGATLTDLAGFAADPLVHDAARSHMAARLVLIETRELAWHRAQYRAEHCLCAPADPVLVSLRTLQHWLWQRLQAPAWSEAHA
ncbi:MAG TPA: hypothetical protein VNE16_15825 [Vicinamibacterales bacterium]|nr:hypothetical protein [Vicinamibacterales bacterium]